MSKRVPLTILIAAVAISSESQEVMTNSADHQQTWNWHVQNTDIVQGDPGFHAKYSGPNSLDSGGEIRETVSLDLLAGVRLWRGAEAHIDGLMWQGFGLSKTRGVDGFPNGKAFRTGNNIPNVNITRLFIRQTIGFGGDQEDVEDDQLQLAGKRDVSRLTLTLGKMSVKGESWRRANDTFGMAGIINGISKVHQEFLEAGGTGVLAGDGKLSYGWEKILETYYDAVVWKTIHIAVDYQFITDPAFNQDRGPVSVIGARLHWEF